MIIGTAGLTNTGSSAISDFLKEFEENQVYTDIEFILSFYPDGLEDLDYHLNEKCSKFLSSCTAIPRFRKAANYLLGIVTKGKIKQLTDDYLDSITQVKWIGKGQGQDLLHNLFLYRNLGIRINSRLMKLLPVSFCKRIRLYPLGVMEFSVKPDDFVNKSQEYTDKIFQTLGLNTEKNIVLDQPFSGNDPVRGMKYYKDARAIVTDRDPRDLYALFKKAYPRIIYQIPMDTVEQFVDYYKYMHRPLNESIRENPNVLMIQFEDLIYRYEETSKDIIDFLNLGEPAFPQKYFQPRKSMINTQVFKKYSGLEDDIKYIERKLPEYLYDFGKYEYNPSCKRIFIEPEEV